MEKSHLQLYLTIICLFLISVSGFAALIDRYTLGIPPEDASYYKSNAIKCKDGSKKFSREQLNDDFCDCVDGTDEPGTSACPEGKFYCHNVGHLPQSIFSSRVNDGICDCCDGSDEYDGTIKCKNSCWEAGKEAREKINKKIKTYQEGVIIRRNEVEKAKRELAKDKEDLSKLKNKEKMLQDLVDKLKEHKERIEKAEEEERLKKEKAEEEERLKKEKEEQKLKESELKTIDQEMIKEDILDESIENAHEAENVHATDSNKMENLDNTYESESSTPIQSGHYSPRDTKIQEIVDDHNNPEAVSGETTGDDNEDKEKELEDSDDTSGLSKEELGRVVASRWTGEHKKDENEIHHDTTVDKNDDDNGYTSEVEDDRQKYDDDFEDEADEGDSPEPVDAEESYNSDTDDKHDLSDMSDVGSTSWMDKIKETVNSVLSSFNLFRTPVDLSEADRIKKEYGDASSKLSKLKSKISSLSKKVAQDFGKDLEFYSFYDQCFESQQNKYNYKVCPFKEATQGHTRLGNWEKFEESYRVMLFSNGEKCWNGPNRSLKVRLRCGLKNEVADVDEPSICEYVGLVSTPAVCTEGKLKELQDKLEKMNSRRTEGHDEL